MSDPGYYGTVATNQRTNGVSAILAMSDALHLAQAEVERLRRVVELARQRIEKIGHTEDCPWRYLAPNAAGHRPKCTCGLDDLLAAITHDAP